MYLSYFYVELQLLQFWSILCIYMYSNTLILDGSDFIMNASYYSSNNIFLIFQLDKILISCSNIVIVFENFHL